MSSLVPEVLSRLWANRFIERKATSVLYTVAPAAHVRRSLCTVANGLDEFRKLAEQSRLLFSEREQRITKLTVGEESLVAEIAYRGCLAVDMPNGLAAGTVMELKGQSEFSFKGGKISKIIDRS